MIAKKHFLRLCACALLVAAAAPGHALAGTISSSNIQGIIASLKANGVPVKADLDNKSSDGKPLPQLVIKYEGEKFGIDFSSCKTTNDCDYIEILSIYNDIDEASAKTIVAEWVKDERFSSVVFIKNGKQAFFSLYHYIIAANEGISEKSFLDAIEYVAKDSSEVRQMFQKIKK